MAFEPGVVKLKNGGGENGHNGLKSVRARLANQDGYNRLRIGVGHPGNKALVNAYLTQQTPPQAEREAVAAAGDLPRAVLEHVLAGNWQSAMTALHTPEKQRFRPARPPAPSADSERHTGVERRKDGI